MYGLDQMENSNFTFVVTLNADTFMYFLRII